MAESSGQMISVILPSMGRPARLVSCVLSTLATTAHLPLEVVVVVDCDEESVRRLVALQEPRVRVLFNAKRRGFIACMNQGLAAAHGDLLVFYNDDCWPESGWLDAALRAHETVLGGYGLVGFNDGYQDGRALSVHYLVDREFCRAVLGGVLAYPCYQFYCNDSEANARAKRAGRFYWCQEAIVQHRHWTRPGFSHKDALDAENERAAAHDIPLFEQRQALGFPNDFEAVLR